MPPQSTPHWHKPYFEHKAMERKYIQVKLSALPLYAQRQDISLQRCPPFLSLAGKTELSEATLSFLKKRINQKLFIYLFSLSFLSSSLLPSFFLFFFLISRPKAACSPGGVSPTPLVETTLSPYPPEGCTRGISITNLPKMSLYLALVFFIHLPSHNLNP